MTTLLELVNRVLLDVGERQVTSISTPASRKARLYIQDAFNDLQMYHNWEWLNGLFAVNSFTEEKTTIDNVRRIRRVYWLDDENRYEISWIPASQFYLQHLESFDTNQDIAESPRFYTQINETQLAFNPYPTTDQGRDKIRVEGIRYITPPSLDTDELTIPERFENVLIKRAVYNMLLRHLGEIDMAQAMNFEFNDILQRFRDQENRTPMKGTNMFRQRARRYI